MIPLQDSPPSVVLDTHVVLDWLVFGDTRVQPLVQALTTGRLRWLGTARMRVELSHVLARSVLQPWSPDEQKVLVKGLAFDLKGRPADHTTNAIEMGIDGWVYIAVGDFGFHNATGTDGTKLTLLGGGIARVRPDGTELEMYTTGTRNIYDVAIDPFMNCFTRGNTNDGGGWNVRFLHHLQSGEYGYPRLFVNFASEIIPALEDVGGGSGVGALFLSEPTWPVKYNNQPLMADWGRKAVYLHRLTPDGPSFTQKPEDYRFEFSCDVGQSEAKSWTVTATTALARTT